MTHPAQEDFVMVFSDEVGDEKNDWQMRSFVKNLRNVAAEHGFDISTWGTADQIRKALVLRQGAKEADEIEKLKFIVAALLPYCGENEIDAQVARKLLGDYRIDCDYEDRLFEMLEEQ